MKITDKKTMNTMEILKSDCKNIYIHPITNEHCQTIGQALSGFSESSRAENLSWDMIHKIVESGAVDDYLNDDADYIIEKEDDYKDHFQN